MKRIMQGAALGAIGCAGIVAASAVPASAAVTNGGESVNLSSPFQVAVGTYNTTTQQSPTLGLYGSDNGFGPISNQGTISGSGYATGSQIYLQVCDGTPSTTSGYSVAAHCAYANAATVVGTSGTFSVNTNIDRFQIFHGVDNNDALFNCLAPGDNPNASTTAVGNQPIQDGLPTWGSTQGASTDGGGGTAPCQLRIGVGPTYSTSDIFIPLTGLDTNPGSTSPGNNAPESPLAVALPVAAVAILGAGSAVAIRRRRRRSHTAA